MVKVIFLLNINQIRWFPCPGSSQWLPCTARIKSHSFNSLHGLISACFFGLSSGWADFFRMLWPCRLLSLSSAHQGHFWPKAFSGLFLWPATFFLHVFTSLLLIVLLSLKSLSTMACHPVMPYHAVPFYFVHSTYRHLKLFISSLSLPK